MLTNDLDLILKHDPIITTFPVSQLQSQPQAVEQLYLTYAKAHLSLGDTDKYVDTIFKWVSGQNKGAFIGAVEGNYGEGKTSFLVHVWAKSQERHIFTVPPFEWISLADAVAAVGAWLVYILGREHPDQAKKAQHLYDQYKEKSLEAEARETAIKIGGDYETILAALTYQQEQGVALTKVSPERFLDFCAQASEIVREVGYQGLLVVLDEPEVAAKKIGKEQVAHILFNLANLLRDRQGEYGVLVSMPTNFLADVTRRFPALTSRLQARNCFPRLRDIYGPDFAEVLWQRYVLEFDLGEKDAHIVSNLALQALGQVGSSERSDLAYGPRTVISAFSRMVYRYRQTGKTYEPEDFAQDCHDDEILVTPEFPSRLKELMRSPEITPENRNALLLLAAFPNGLRIEAAQERGADKVLRDLARRGTLVYKTAATFGLNALRKEGVIQADPIREAVLEFDDEFAPNRTTAGRVMEAFKNHVIPLLFEQRQGQQLKGWDNVSAWRKAKNGVWFSALTGAFLQTANNYPKRAVLAIIGSVDDSLDDIEIPDLPEGSGVQEYDAVFHFRLRWNTSQELQTRLLDFRPGDPTQPQRFGYVGITIDLLQNTDAPPAITDIIETENVTSLWLLNLIYQMDQEHLPKEFDAHWQAMRRTTLRDLIPLFLGEELNTQASDQVGQSVVGSGLSLLGSLFQKILLLRYPKYSTLVHSPHWQERIADYVQALKNPDIPLACKRGREKWRAEGETAPKAFRTSRMNLSNAFEGLDSLVSISSPGRNAPLEVQFRIHPLEQTIADLICGDRCTPDKKLKIDGKECWWLPITELIPTLRSSGYTLEEIAKIFEIGNARGTFSLTVRDREQIVYCKPIDPDQMRRQLQEKLDDLVQEIGEFCKLHDFHTRFDAAEIGAQIASVQDEAEYERLVVQLNKEFVELHQRLPGFFDRLEQELRMIRSDVQKAAGQLVGSREVTILNTIPSAKSPWGTYLGRYIVRNLKQTVEEHRTESTALIKDLDGFLARYRYQSQILPVKNIAPLVEGNAKAVDAKARADAFVNHTRAAMTNLRLYEDWLNLLRRSDQVYEQLLDLQSKELDQDATRKLMEEFDRFSRDISDHIEVRNLSGLTAHRQFAAQLDDIDRDRQVYIGQVKAEFDRCKESVNSFLQALKLDRRVNTTFNSQSSRTSYKEMYEQGATHVREAAFARSLLEIEVQEREMRYAQDVLGTVELEQVNPLLNRLKKAREAIEVLDTLVTGVWMQENTDEQHVEERKNVIEAVDEALDAVRTSRTLVKEATKATIPVEGRAKEMHELIVQSGAIDLKDIILRMMSENDNAGHVLDQSLESLVELFRANCIQIRVERRRD